MAIDIVTEEIATNLEEVAAVTRGISGKGVGLVIGGLVVGAAVGFYIGYRFNREKIKAEAFAESEVEIEKIRAFYEAKATASLEKPSIEDLVEKYATAPEEPKNQGSGTKNKKKTTGKRGGRPTRPPVVIRESPIPPPTPPPPPKDENEDLEWDYAKELENRTRELPYVISTEEFMDEETVYSKHSYTYYAGDDVLVGEDEHPLPHADIIVGQSNLKFGYGSNDVDVVYIRNEHMELDMEVTRTPLSYEEEVLGIDRDESN